MKFIQYLFRDKRQFRLFLILCVSTLFNLALVLYRIHYTQFNFAEIVSVGKLADYRGEMTFLFLIWNLFLAWIPYWISIALSPIYNRTKSKILSLALMASWLLFLPNAPYILTDLLHLRSRFPIPHWYDVMMLFSFAWTGLMLGLMSMYEVQLFLEKKINRILVHSMMLITIAASSFGIWLGRFHRWNSWDILSNPIALFQDIATQFIDPATNWRTLSIVVVLSVFLSLSYFTVVTLIGDKTTS